MIRRKFLSLITSGGTAIIAGFAGIITSVCALSPAFQGRRRRIWQPVGKMEDFAVGNMQECLASTAGENWPRRTVPRAVFVWRPKATETVVFSRSCTDLGCQLNYDAGSTCFLCPCHGGIFSQNGERMAGPPNKPMHRFIHRVSEGVLEIELTSVPVGL